MLPRLLCASEEAGLESHRSLALGRRLVELALLSQHVAQVVVRLGKIRPKSNRLPIPCHGLVELALLVKMLPRLLCAWKRPGLRATAVESGRRFVELALVREHVAQVVVRLGDVGPQRENLPISRGGLGQPPRAMFALRQGNESVQLGWLSGSGTRRRHPVSFSLGFRPEARDLGPAAGLLPLASRLSLPTECRQYHQL